MRTANMIDKALAVAYKHPFSPDRLKMVAHGQSFTPLIYNLTNIMKPETVFEWGPGQSTHAFLMGDPNVRVTSYENDFSWADRYELELKKKAPGMYKRSLIIKIKYPQYIETEFDYNNFDIVLIDGRHRAECVKNAEQILKPNGVLLVHDTQREPLRHDIFKATTIRYYKDHTHVTGSENTSIFIKE